MREVYVVTTGWKYEGEQVHGVFADKQAATDSARSAVESRYGDYATVARWRIGAEEPDESEDIYRENKP